MTLPELERVLEAIDEAVLDSVGDASLAVQLRRVVRTAVDDLLIVGPTVGPALHAEAR